MVSQHALQQVSRGWWYPSKLAGFQAHTQGGSLGEWHLARGVSRPTPSREVEGDLAGGVSRPTPGGSAPGGDAPPGWLLLRAVCILLECILV